MADAQQVRKTDNAVQKLGAALDTQIANMQAAINEVESIKSDIQSHYQADSATSYLNKLQNWLDSHQTILSAAKTCRADVTQADAAFNSGDSDALSNANSWSPDSDTTYSALVI